MYATVRRYEGITDPAEVGRRVREGFVPLSTCVEPTPRVHDREIGGRTVGVVPGHRDGAGSVVSSRSRFKSSS
jgi:hypothetical protein